LGGVGCSFGAVRRWKGVGGCRMIVVIIIETKFMMKIAEVTDRFGGGALELVSKIVYQNRLKVKTKETSLVKCEIDKR
jgi:hypothetical protein